MVNEESTWFYERINKWFHVINRILNCSLPKNANVWIKERVDLFNEKVKKKEIPNRLKHFLNFYLEPDGKINLKI